ncbi:MAG: hypothetical protein DMG45_25750, partial [Acidobacteria bacterium]
STLGAGGSGTFSLSRTGVIALTYGRPDNPGDIAISNMGAMKVLTSLNQELLAQNKPGHVEEISVESSKDNRKIQGWIVHPPDFDPSKKYPLVLEIHGGPFADYGDRFDFEKQVLASRGYVVLYINPRGSTSYGEEFANLIHHAYPGDDFYDLNRTTAASIFVTTIRAIPRSASIQWMAHSRKSPIILLPRSAPVAAAPFLCPARA